MNPETYHQHLNRLVSGLNVKALGAEQIEAIHETVVRANRLTAPEWQHVVNLALAGGRWPTSESWDKYAERAKLAVRGIRAASERPCDCGGGMYEPRRGVWVFVGSGRFVPGPKDPHGAVDRMMHPHRWAAAIEHVCSRCRAGGWLMLDDGRSARGRSWRAGDFIATSSSPITGLDEPEIPASDHAYRSDPEKAERYQDARRALLMATQREKLPPRVVADRLTEIADAFPEKAATLVAEASALAYAGTPRMRSSGVPDPGIPDTPTMRDGGHRTCSHERVREAMGATVCADCGADRLPGGDFDGGSVDSLRYPWTPEAAMSWRRGAIRALAKKAVEREAGGPPVESGGGTHAAGLAAGELDSRPVSGPYTMWQDSGQSPPHVENLDTDDEAPF